MFQEETNWDVPELDSSLSEALLAKPVATPTKSSKSRNKYRPDSKNKGKRASKRVQQPYDETTPLKRKPDPHDDTTPASKRSRVKGAKAEGKKKHVKCAVFDSMDNWSDVILQHELEDPTNENLATYIKTVAKDIEKENQEDNSNMNDGKAKKKKKKDKKRKSVHFEDDVIAPTEISFTTGTSEALSNMNLEDGSVTESTTSSMKAAKDKINKLKGKFQKKLDASQFRFINEKLYTTSGKEAEELFLKKPELFDVYHRGFSNQVEKWDTNPVDLIIEFLKTCDDEAVIADFGCGDAKIARSLSNPVFSFDLVKANEHVIVANSNNVPLGDKSCDVAVFCLSLMGTDFKEFIREARRVLKPKGVMCIAEVTSRIADIDVFVEGVQELGFKCVKKDTQNNYFVNLRFRKVKPKENKGSFDKLTLKPCTYKKR